jgi:anti-sigma B factor antagonist
MSERAAAFNVDVVETPDGPVVRARGDLDLSTADDLERAAFPLIKAPSATLTVDLSGVDFCDSAGINALVKLRKSCDASGWRLAVSNPQPHVRHVLELSGLIAFLGVSPA